MMKIFKLPKEIKALIFDMDLTLYSNDEYGQYQVDCLVEKLGNTMGRSFEEMNLEVKEARKKLAMSGNGRQPSLANVLTSYGISMEEIVRWRNELFEPERYVGEDKKLKETLEKLSKFFVLGVVTNNPVLVANKTFAALGISGLFPIVIGLDTCMTSKPHRIQFEKFIELSGCEAETCVSIGDRYDIDLAIPMEMGMGGILVDGVEDVYELPLKVIM